MNHLKGSLLVSTPGQAPAPKNLGLPRRIASEYSILIKDAISLLHPKPKDIQRAQLYKKILQGDFEKPFSLATTLADASKKGILLKDIWEELINSDRLDYVSLLLNFKNVLEADISKDSLKIALDKISDEKQAKILKVSPFTFLEAFLNIYNLKSFNASKVRKTIEQVVNVSMDNITFFNDKKSVIASDVSGSMYYPVYKNSKIEFFDIGLFVSMLINARVPDTIAGVFGDVWKILELPEESIPGNLKMFRRITGSVGYSVNAFKVFEWALNEKINADMFLFFTDREIWDGYGQSSDFWNLSGIQNENVMEKAWNKYKSQINPHARLFLFAFAGQSNVPLKILKNEIYLINRWSDRIFDVLEWIENRENALEKINNMVL